MTLSDPNFPRPSSFVNFASPFAALKWMNFLETSNFAKYGDLHNGNSSLLMKNHLSKGRGRVFRRVGDVNFFHKSGSNLETVQDTET